MIFQEPCIKSSILTKGLRKFLDYLKYNNIAICLISNTPVPGVCHDETLKFHNIYHFFKYRFYSYDLGIRKPNLKIFEIALKKTETDIENALMIGDSMQLDIEPALKIGMRALLYDLQNKNNKYPYSFNSYEKLFLKNYILI